LNVELHIERLLVTGLRLPPGGRAALADVMGAELSRLIQDGGLGPAVLSGASTPRLTATLGPSARTEANGQLGRELARSVYSCLGREPRTAVRRP
jgi:hypothetical protein